MNCQRQGCGNKKKGNGHYRSVMVEDRRVKARKSYTEKWCMECVGKLQPNRYRLVYFVDGRQLKMKRIPLPENEVKELARFEADIAPIEHEDLGKLAQKTNRNDAGQISALKAARRKSLKNHVSAPIEGE